MHYILHHDFGVAECTITDQNNHVISEGCNYILGQYFQKEKEKKNKDIYKLLPDQVYVIPSQVMCPAVNLIDNELTVQEYQWFSDKI